MPGRTLFEKIWTLHAVAELSSELSLLAIDRHFLHDLEGGPNFMRLAKLGHRVHDSDLTFAMPDHAISSLPGRATDTNPTGGRLLREMRRGASAAGIKLFDIGDDGQGIVHVAAPEMVWSYRATVLPGQSHLHARSSRALRPGRWLKTKIAAVLATQTLQQKKPKTMRIGLESARVRGVLAKDVILSTIGQLGTAVGRGHALKTQARWSKN